MKPVKSLEKIIISKTRLGLLQEFFYYPGKMFYIRQLTRLTGQKINSVRRELENLKSAGVLEEERRANKIFYWTNEKFVFFQEILSFVLKSKGLGKHILEKRHKLGQIKYVFFSDQFARNAEYDKDIIDVFIIGKVVLPELGVLIRQAEKKRGREINYTVMSLKDFNYRRENRDPFIFRVLLQPRFMIIGEEQRMLE